LARRARRGRKIAALERWGSRSKRRRRDPRDREAMGCRRCSSRAGCSGEGLLEVVVSSWFVAFPVPTGEWFARLSPAPNGTRLLSATDLHLTVAFLGNVEERCARAAFQALEPAAIGRFEILLSAVVPMGNPRRPSALSALIDPRDSEGRSIADLLAPARDVILDAAGLPPETRAMKPHVTLARVRRNSVARDRQRALAWAAECSLASVRIGLDRISLYTGSRDRSSRAYDIAESRPLGPPVHMSC
jgi:2'-5' RNA ligase